MSSPIGYREPGPRQRRAIPSGQVLDRWPDTREAIQREYDARWRAYLALDYTPTEALRWSLFEARTTSAELIARTRRLAGDLRFVTDVNAAAIAPDRMELTIDAPDWTEARTAMWLEMAEAVWVRSRVRHRARQWATSLCALADWRFEAVRGDDGALVLGQDPRRLQVWRDRYGLSLTSAALELSYTPDAVYADDGTLASQPEPRTYVRVLTPDEIRVWDDRQPVADETGPNLLGVVPVTACSYQSVGEDLGLTPAHGLVSTLATADSLITQLTTIGTRTAAPVLKAMGVDPGDASEVTQIDRAAALPEGTDLQWLEASLQGVQVLLETQSALIAQARQTYPEFFVLEAGASASGVALSTRAKAFEAKVSPARADFLRALARATSMAVCLDQGIPWDEEHDVLRIEGGPILPMDVPARVSLLLSLVESGALLREDLIRALESMDLVSADMTPAEYAAMALAEQSAGLEAMGAAALRGLDTAPPVDAEEPGPEGSTGEVATDDTE